MGTRSKKHPCYRCTARDISEDDMLAALDIARDPWGYNRADRRKAHRLIRRAAKQALKMGNEHYTPWKECVLAARALNLCLS